jgi:fructose-1,6-bisphosphatase I
MKVRTLADVVESEDQAFRKLVSLLSDLSQQIVAEIPHSLGVTEGTNVYGETQTEIDVWSNELLTKKLIKSGLVNQVASEEMEETIKGGNGEFSVVLDPLDGSSNIKTDNLVGTIVGVYHDKELPARGRDLFSSMYFLYGPYTEAVLAISSGVFLTVAAGKGRGSERFLCTVDAHRFPEKPSVYGIGGAKDKWGRELQGFVDSLEKRKLKMRYGGSFVGDYNQVLHNGGFFAYPALSDAPEGKYRLQFESNPVGFITEKAGGRASTGKGNVLEVEPTGISQRVPTYLGNRDLVTEFEGLARTTAFPKPIQ